MKLPDFSNFQLDDCELIAFQIGVKQADITMRFRCPVKGWRRKKAIPALIREVIWTSPYVEFDVSLRFLDVTSINTLPIGMFASKTLFEHGLPVLSDVRFLETAGNRGRALFEFDESTLELEFADCVQTEKGNLEVT